MTILTTKGERALEQLARTLGFEDRPDAMVIWVEYRLDGELVRRDAFKLPTEVGAEVYTTQGMVPRSALVRTIELGDTDDEISVAVIWRRGPECVRRDAHVILKKPTAEAMAVAAAL